MGAVFDLLQDVEGMRNPLRLWINLWMDYPESLHREAGFRFMEKAQHLG
jgi:hypothetical protein